MTNQQGAPEALRLADALQAVEEGWSVADKCCAELRRLHYENERLAALVEAQQPAPSAAGAVGEVPLPLLVRDIAADLGTTPIQVCTALAQLGFGGHSVNMAVTPRMAQSLRAHFASTTPQADSAPSAAAEVFANPHAELRATFAIGQIWQYRPRGVPTWTNTRTPSWLPDYEYRRHPDDSAAPQPSPTPQADSQPAPDQRQQLDAYYSLLDAMGWESKRQHISPETWAADLLRDATAYRAARAQADPQLLKFYGVTTDAELIAAQARHIERLQAKLPQTTSFAPQRVREG